MLRREGFTLMEIIVVLIIIGIAVGFFFPYFTKPDEVARAANAQNNLLAIYSAEQNYNNNNGGNGSYCTASCNTISNINTALSLNIQDDGAYGYACSLGPPPTCTATRSNGPAAFSITVRLNTPIQLTVNPTCTSTTCISDWCSQKL